MTIKELLTHKLVFLHRTPQDELPIKSCRVNFDKKCMCSLSVCRRHPTRRMPVQIFSRQMPVGGRAGADTARTLRTHESEQVRPRELRIHRLFQRRDRHRRLALFWPSYLQSARSRRELHEHETVPRGSQALSLSPVLMCRRSVTAAECRPILRVSSTPPCPLLVPFSNNAPPRPDVPNS